MANENDLRSTSLLLRNKLNIPIIGDLVPIVDDLRTLAGATGGIVFKRSIGSDSIKPIGGTNVTSGNYSTIAGGKVNGDQGANLTGVYSAILGGYRNHTRGTHSAVGGGRGNYAIGNYSGVLCGYVNVTNGTHSVIGGGKDNYANGDYSGVLSGYNNNAYDIGSIIGGGRLHEAKGNYSGIFSGYSNRTYGIHNVISGGYYNNSNGTNSVIGGGSTNYATANYSGVFSGTYNSATGLYSAVLGGIEGLASRPAEQANASGKFASKGDAQHSSLVSRVATTNATANVESFLDGISATQRISVAPGQTLAFQTIFVARQTGGAEGTAGDSARLIRAGLIKNVAGTTALVGTIDTIGADKGDVALARLVTVTLAGTSGTADVTVETLTKTATFNTDLPTTASDFVTSHAAAYAAVGITLTSSAADLIYTADLISQDFALGSTANTSGDLAGSHVLTNDTISVAVTANNTNDTLKLAVTGQVSKNINWVSSIDLTQNGV